MPSERRQFNVRLDEEMHLLVLRLLRRLRTKLRLPEVSRADLLRMALTALEKEYPADEEEPNS